MRNMRPIPPASAAWAPPPFGPASPPPPPAAPCPPAMAVWGAAQQRHQINPRARAIQSAAHDAHAPTPRVRRTHLLLRLVLQVLVAQRRVHGVAHHFVDHARLAHLYGAAGRAAAQSGHIQARGRGAGAHSPTPTHTPYTRLRIIAVSHASQVLSACLPGAPHLAPSPPWFAAAEALLPSCSPASAPRRSWTAPPPPASSLQRWGGGRGHQPAAS